MKQIKSQKLLNDFKTKYEKVSGSSVPVEYLQNAKVYGKIKKGKLIGGYVLNKVGPLRTTKCFSSASKEKEITEIISGNTVTEVCCLWLEYKYRRSPKHIATLWLHIGLSIHFCSAKLILYGTNVRGLAKIYSYPRRSYLLNLETINGKSNYIFIARRTDFLWGVLDIIRSRVGIYTRKTNNQKNQYLII